MIVRFIYRTYCFFFVSRGNCMLDRRCCFLCSYSQKKIDRLDLRGHLDLVMSRKSSRASLYISILALLVAIAGVLVDAFFEK